MSDGNQELASCRLKCDNPKCDWKVESIPVEILQEWVNAKCPKCGESVLTLNDYINALISIDSAKSIREFSSDELKAMSENKVIKELLELQIYKGNGKVTNIELAELLTNF